MTAPPKVSRDRHRIDIVGSPPLGLVAGVVQFLMVGRTERHGELVGDFAPEGVGLCEGQVMGMRPVLAADEAALTGDELEMFGIAQAPRFGDGQRRLVDTLLAW